MATDKSYAAVVDGEGHAEEDPLRGLSSEEAEELLKQYGKNEIPEEKPSWVVMLLKQFIGVMPFMIEVRPRPGT